MENNKVDIENNEAAAKKNDYVMKLPESEKPKEETIEPNRPAHWSMRMAAGFIDFCILFLAMLGFREIYMRTGMGTAYRHHANEALRVSDTYKLKPLLEGSDETFGYKMYEDDEKYQAHVSDGYLVYVEEETNKSYVVANHEEISDELQKAFKKAVKADSDYSKYSFNARFIEFGIVSLSGVCSEIVFLLVIPLLNSRRATIGKWFAGLQVIHSKLETNARWYQMVGRFFWVVIFESVLPLLFLSSVITMPIVMCLLIFIVSMTNKNRRTIHDFVSRTRVIEAKSFVKLMDQ